jgi:uncharacterized protein YjbJ (UPF0337 family)
MDWNRVEGNWKQVKGKVKEKWGKLTDDDLDVVAGRRDQLEGKIQERYGIAKDQVRKLVTVQRARATTSSSPRPGTERGPRSPRPFSVSKERLRVSPSAGRLQMFLQGRGC